MMKNVFVVLMLVCFGVPIGNARPQDARNLMWCSAKSGQTVYYSAWFRYSDGQMDTYGANFQRDTKANYNLKTIEAPSCRSFEITQNASDAFDASVKAQKKAGLKVVTTGWMPQ